MRSLARGAPEAVSLFAAAPRELGLTKPVLRTLHRRADGHPARDICFLQKPGTRSFRATDPETLKRNFAFVLLRTPVLCLKQQTSKPPLPPSP